MGHLASKEFKPLNVAVLTVSDTRTEENDTSGQLLADSARQVGHQVVAHKIVKDDVYQLRAVVSTWIASTDVQVVLVTGGTGFTQRDSTPEALKILFDKEVEGFGELFRQISYQQISTSTIQSRAIAGFANGTIIFCMPGSTNACRTAWEEIIRDQLDARYKLCNFVPHLKETDSEACETRG
ncbi:MAG: molybdenum cofactor biosynthesis protein B [Gammaproteobacteria bacterium]|nr:molybdenum cofactor biosynthesis protein B [Gammaproteobacteria bacterium]